VLASFVLIGLGFLFIIKPKVVWNISDSWKSKGSKGPSDAYKVITRIQGLALLLVGIYLMF